MVGNGLNDFDKVLFPCIFSLFGLGIPAGLLAFIIDYFYEGFIGDPFLAAIMNIFVGTLIGGIAFCTMGM